MLWLLELHQVYILFSMLLLLMLYAAVVTVRVNMPAWAKVLIIPLIFTITYQSMVVSEILVGKPSYSEAESQGILGGYVIFDKNGHKEIAFLLNTKDRGPTLFAVPYDPDTEKGLSQAMQKLATKGIPTMVRKKGKAVDSQGEEGEGKEGEGKGDGRVGKGGIGGGSQKGPLEFYDFTDQYLVPKNPS